MVLALELIEHAIGSALDQHVRAARYSDTIDWCCVPHAADTRPGCSLPLCVDRQLTRTQERAEGLRADPTRPAMSRFCSTCTRLAAPDCCSSWSRRVWSSRARSPPARSVWQLGTRLPRIDPPERKCRSRAHRRGEHAGTSPLLICCGVGPSIRGRSTTWRTSAGRRIDALVDAK